MRAGEIVAQGSLEQIRANGQTRLIVNVDNTKQAKEVLKAAGIAKSKSEGNKITASVSSDFDVAKLNKQLVAKKISVSEIRLEHPSLEEYFVDLTGEGFEVVR
jgi:ABC-2 type transport system ATP-binding protein